MEGKGTASLRNASEALIEGDTLMIIGRLTAALVLALHISACGGSDRVNEMTDADATVGTVDQDAALAEPDAAVITLDSGASEQDAVSDLAVPESDASIGEEDVSLPEQDGSVVDPDSAVQERDAAGGEPDAMASEADAVTPPDTGVMRPDAMMEPDVAMMERDAAILEPDAAMLEPDAAPLCRVGEARCTDDGVRVVCSEDRQGFDRAPCAVNDLCVDGRCEAQLCLPDALGCDGDTARRCNGLGDGFLMDEAEDCAGQGLGCVDGACVDAVAASRGAVCATTDCLSARRANVVCGRYEADIVDAARGPFQRGANRCDPGSLTDAAYAEALRATNYGRWLAGVAEVSFEEALNPPAQACATIMANQGNLSHNPTPDWACFTEAGAEGAAISNIQVTFGGEPVPQSVVRFLWDEGPINRRAVGHRRWMQSPTVGTIGFGYHEGLFTGDSAVCLSVIRGAEVDPTGPPFVAYPAPGPFPRELLKRGRLAMPWSVAVNSPFVDDWPATDQWRVSVNRVVDGVREALEIQHLSANAQWHGRTRAVVFTPDFEIDEGRYEITVESGERRFAWETEIVRCAR